MSLNKVGIYVWGFITVVLALGALALVLLAGYHLYPSGETFKFDSETPACLPGLYFAVKENGSLLAGILAFSGLAWAGFFKAENQIT
tara:strand:- start:160 stop:420 length:261 start_codon:yes stop_codon:yes gene_type:complete